MEYITKPIPYIEENEGKFEVIFVEPGTVLSTYQFDNLRDAKICALKVKPLVEEAFKQGLIDEELVSNEEFVIEPLVDEYTDSYGFRTVITTPYEGEPIVEIFDTEGNLVTEEEIIEFIRNIENESIE